MPLLDSFTVDHTRMEAPAVRVAKTMHTPHGDTITVFDLRFCVPNQEVMPEKGIHTLEHLFAGFMRDHLNGNGVEIIDISPMGCRTGFYLILAGDQTSSEILELVKETFEYIRDFEGNVPGASARDCGNYLDMNLPMAKLLAYKYLTFSLYTANEKNLNYPE